MTVGSNNQPPVNPIARPNKKQPRENHVSADRFMQPSQPLLPIYHKVSPASTASANCREICRQSAAAPYRHSRVSGNPEMTVGNMPVYAITVLDSRLRGNDGKEGGNNDNGGCPG